MKSLLRGIAVSSVLIALTQDGSRAQTAPAGQMQTQIATPEGINVVLTASKMQRGNDVIQLNGNVTITTREMLMRADEADYHEKTADIELRGNVRVKLAAQH
jgi:lipopolysaccharide assembly outer membrane protein LptD (OstA)